MKRFLLCVLLIAITTVGYAQTITAAMGLAQFIPTFEAGLKGGANFSTLTGGGLNTNNQAGYLFGAYAKVGKLIQFQPEIYITGKNVNLTDSNGVVNKVKFTSIDVPLLLVKNFGALGFGAHILAGPVISFVVDKNQSLGGAYDKIAKFEYNNQAVALTVGGGIEVQGFTVDARYEIGLDKLTQDGYPNTRISMFNVSIGFRIY